MVVLRLHPYEPHYHFVRTFTLLLHIKLFTYERTFFLEYFQKLDINCITDFFLTVTAKTYISNIAITDDEETVCQMSGHSYFGGQLNFTLK